MSNTDQKKKSSGFFATIGRWLGRAFFPGREVAEMNIFEVEKLESPSRLAVKAFFRRKLAVVALVVLILLFLFSFIGQFIWKMDLTYTDPLQANIAPNMSLRNVPKGLKNDIKTISGFSNFTVGVNNDGKFFIWGFTRDNMTNINYADVPDEVKNGKVVTAVAGSDHIVAITEDGKLHMWGANSRGQLGVNTGNPDDPVVELDKNILENGIGDLSKLDQIIAGYQVTAMVLDGKLYMWGNSNNIINMRTFVERTDSEGNVIGYDNVQKVALTNYYAVLLLDDGSIVTTDWLSTFDSAVSNKSGKIPSFLSYLKNKKVVDICATNNSLAILLEDGEVLVAGDTGYGVSEFPDVPDDEKIVNIESGTRHFAALTKDAEGKTRAYAWGHNEYKQASVSGKSAAAVFCGAKQTYLVDEDNDLIRSYGLSGYLFGTDGQGRDTLTRIVHGGKMTLTIGVVAVIIEAIIGIIVGCIAGYFGGWIDMLLMRITEIFSALPFLPFAMMLSYVLQTTSVGANTKIFIIMVILGLLSWTGLATMIRAQVLAEREKEFVIAAQAMGIKESRIAFKHILPNIISVILVSMTLSFAGCLLTESSLSYLGFGVQLPQPTWGNMLNGANNSIVIQNYWWQWLFPSIFLSLATISINIIGDTLRDVLDPKSSSEK